MNIVKKALKVMEESLKMEGTMLNGSDIAKDYCRLHLGSEPEEVFGCLFMTSKNELIAFEKLFRGTVNESSVHLRPIVRLVIQHNAAKVIFSHNHPSGDTSPSKDDVDITKIFSKFLKEIDCQVIDHIIVSKTESTSLAELGKI